MRGITVYYDKSCPLCETEMGALQARGAGMDLVDCSAPGFPEEGVDGVKRERMMARMHARTPEGKWLVGLDAFEAIYASAGLPRAARLWRSGRLRPLLDPAYAFIARHRQALSRLGLQRVLGPLLRRL